jgi:ArsR family transcriptional regulator
VENNNYANWADILKTIGHPARIKIIETLLDHDKCVSNIWGCLELPQATVSQHLSLLRVKGIVQQVRCGARMQYSVRDRKIEEIIKLIKGLELT